MVKQVNMEIHMDPDVKKVLEFMETNLPIRKCVDVANAVKELAIPLWGRYIKPTDRYDNEYFVSICLKRKPLSQDDTLPRSATKE
jgi:hypothetical protein